ncbi:MAG: alpha-N-arabinofuranosidase [Acidobacteriaceae bacterium]|nr:alpha-N-arabinofuranosidase [Acidobacteriaceae bacterium]
MSRTLCARKLAVLCLVGGVAAVSQTIPQPASLDIDVSKPVHKVSPMLYGLMTEEINYSYDGGLYAELVRNRVFRDQTFTTEKRDPAHWTLVEVGDARASMAVQKTTGPSAALTDSLKVSIEKADAASPAGVENEGYWGIPLRANTAYHGSLYAKTDTPSLGPLTVSLISNNSGAVVAKATVPALSPEWKQYTFELRTGAIQPSAENHLTLSVQNPGTLWLDLVSLFPPTYHNRPNGNRIDLMEKLAAMKPAFLRFPGGNYLEGDHIADRFDWKKTIGPLVDRPTHPSPWRYHSSDGMGLLEFLEWCEDLHMQPVLAVYAGYSLARENVAPGPDLEPYVQDALDEIDYVSGKTDTQWGARRAKDGHPAPFPLTYVEVGNEDQFDKSGSYDARYAQFYDAIKKRYPRLQLIATTAVKSRRPDVIDDHFYRSAEAFFEDDHHYDKTDRNGPKVFVGEWATREGTPTPNFHAALGDAAWMTGMERNSDVVIMASYAPLLVNVNPGGMQWATDLIGYDGLISYGSPGYYAQVIFSNHVGDEVAESSVQGMASRFFHSATINSATGALFLKLVNASSVAQPLEIRIHGARDIGANGKLTSLTARDPDETNTISAPTRIKPVETVLPNVRTEFRYTVPPYSIQVLEISAKRDH